MFNVLIMLNGRADNECKCKLPLVVISVMHQLSFFVYNGVSNK